MVKIENGKVVFKTSNLQIFSIAYLLIPLILFLMGWLEWYVSFPLIGGFLYYGYQLACLAQESKEEIYIPIFDFFVAILFCFLVSFFTGMSGHWQQHSDYYARNLYFDQLIQCSWPMRSLSGDYIIYYFQGYLPAALIGKLIGFTGGSVFLLVWIVIGLLLIFCQLSQILKKTSFLIIITFFLFNSADVLPFNLYDFFINNTFLGAGESVSEPFYTLGNEESFRSFSYAFVPVILVLSLLLSFSQRVFALPLYGLLIAFYLPLAAPSAFLFLVYYFLRNGIHFVIEQLKSLLVPVFLSVITLYICVKFYISPNQEVNALELLGYGTLDNIIRGVLFFLFTYIFWIILAYARQNKILLLITIFSGLITTFLGMRYGLDFRLKGAIVPQFFLYVCVCKKWFELSLRKRWFWLAIICVFVFPASFPFFGLLASCVFVGSFYVIRGLRNIKIRKFCYTFPVLGIGVLIICSIDVREKLCGEKTYWLYCQGEKNIEMEKLLAERYPGLKGRINADKSRLPIFFR